MQANKMKFDNKSQNMASPTTESQNKARKKRTQAILVCDRNLLNIAPY